MIAKFKPAKKTVPPNVVSAPNVVTSPKVEHRIERMKRAAKPNEGQPLSHRNRSKAGRKG